MQKPDLNQMWETFIKIGLPNEVPHTKFYPLIRTKVYPTISDLEQKGLIDWYCFLVHNKKSGVPTTEDDDNLYFHIRFSLKKEINSKDFLPNYCVMTRHIEHGLESITGINKSIIRNEEIEEAWRIIGEQSEWFLEMLSIHKEDVGIPPNQIGTIFAFLR